MQAVGGSGHVGAVLIPAGCRFATILYCSAAGQAGLVSLNTQLGSWDMRSGGKTMLVSLLTLKRDDAEVGFLPMDAILGRRQATPPASVAGDGVVPQLQYAIVFHDRVICPDAQSPKACRQLQALAGRVRAIHHQVHAACLAHQQVIHE